MTTLTYQPEQNQPELSEDEIDSLRVGEEMLQQEEQLLAGKYQNAEDLEKAYIELQSKFSSGERESTEEPQQTEEEVEPDVDLMEALWEEAQNEWTEETIEKLRNSDPIDIAQAYLEYRAENQEHQLTSDETQTLYDVVGGEQEYNSMLQWASNNMDENMISAYDSVMQKGDPASCLFAVQALAFQMAEKEGWTPEDFLSGSSPQTKVNAFRSQAEVVEAMNDPRYDRDPAYRQDIMNKLERSSDLMY